MSCLKLVSVVLLLVGSTSATPINATLAPSLFGFTFPTLPSLENLLPPTPCVGVADPRAGSCRPPAACPASGGVPDGACPLTANVCCLPVVKCGATSLTNNTVIANADYPQATNASQLCTFTIRFVLPNIAAIRLQIDELDIAQPDERGVCNQDQIEVDGVPDGVRIAPLCGLMGGQHLIFPVRRDISQITIRVATSLELPRRWLIRVQQLEQTNPSLPRDGCRQYFAGSQSGVVRSYNFNEDTQQGLGMLRGENYAACFRREAGYCRIRFTPVYFNLSPRGAIAVPLTKRGVDYGATETAVIVNGSEPVIVTKRNAGYEHVHVHEHETNMTINGTAPIISKRGIFYEQEPEFNKTRNGTDPIISKRGAEAEVDCKEGSNSTKNATLPHVISKRATGNDTIVTNPPPTNGTVTNGTQPRDIGAAPIDGVIPPVSEPGFIVSTDPRHCEGVSSVTLGNIPAFCGTDFNGGLELEVSSAPFEMWVRSSARPGLGFALRYQYMICDQRS